jgi:hypothetical protein
MAPLPSKACSRPSHRDGIAARGGAVGAARYASVRGSMGRHRGRCRVAAAGGMRLVVVFVLEAVPLLEDIEH